MQSKGLSRVFSNTTLQKHQFFHTQLSLQQIALRVFRPDSYSKRCSPRPTRRRHAGPAAPGEVPVIPREKPHTGAAARENPRGRRSSWKPLRRPRPREMRAFFSCLSPSLAFPLDLGARPLCRRLMQEKKALISRGRGRLRGFLELRRPWGISEVVKQKGSEGKRQGDRVEGPCKTGNRMCEGMSTYGKGQSSQCDWKG